VLGESLSTYVDREAVERALDPDASVTMRDSRGGPAPAALADSLERARGTLAEDREALEERRDARARRERAVDGYV